MQNSIKNIIKSTLIVTVISALGGLGAYLFNLSFWATFVLLFSIQFILFSFVANLVTSYFTEKTRQKELDVLEPLSTILECAYCNKPNIMTFFPNQNERIEFECEKCKNKNFVNLTFTVARITDPVDTKNLTGIPLVEEKQ